MTPEAHATACARLRHSPRYAFLETTTRDERDGALAAANIAKLLSVELPSVGFDVTRPHASAVHVRWIDGATEYTVYGLIKRFQRAAIDEPCGDPWPSVFGGAEFVMCYRSYSSAFLVEVIDELYRRRELGNLPLPSPEAFLAGQLAGVPVPGRNEDLHALIELKAAATAMVWESWT